MAALFFWDMSQFPNNGIMLPSLQPTQSEHLVFRRTGGSHTTKWQPIIAREERKKQKRKRLFDISLLRLLGWKERKKAPSAVSFEMKRLFQSHDTLQPQHVRSHPAHAPPAQPRTITSTSSICLAELSGNLAEKLPIHPVELRLCSERDQR